MPTVMTVISCFTRDAEGRENFVTQTVRKKEGVFEPVPEHVWLVIDSVSSSESGEALVPKIPMHEVIWGILSHSITYDAKDERSLDFLLLQTKVFGEDNFTQLLHELKRRGWSEI